MRTDKYRFLLIQALCPPGADAAAGGKEARLMNHADVAPFLDGVAWDLHPGPPSLNDFGSVETREEFTLIGARRLPIVRAACESGQYNAVVLLGGGDPGFLEAREVGHAYGIPVTSCANAQMHVATMLGQRFSVLDVAELHNMRMRDVVVQYGFAERCASIRNIGFHLPRPCNADLPLIAGEKEKAARGEPPPCWKPPFAKSRRRSRTTAPKSSSWAARRRIGCSRTWNSGCTRRAGPFRFWKATAAPSCRRRRWSI